MQMFKKSNKIKWLIQVMDLTNASTRSGTDDKHSTETVKWIMWHRDIQVALGRISIYYSFFLFFKPNKYSNMEQFQILNKGIGGKEHKLISTNKSFRNFQNQEFLFDMKYKMYFTIQQKSYCWWLILFNTKEKSYPPVQFLGLLPFSFLNFNKDLSVVDIASFARF